ncbi:hypothetical protein PIB30_042493 [Stylosanthes scabra]|uniref:Uncharacterized protein n=1 Tax=Stylosanthes scabra TaxID=79078 RepID=A0ABU6ZE05_9FABA|nr:hypothetical protein [Stylosanthes scabra]
MNNFVLEDFRHGGHEANSESEILLSPSLGCTWIGSDPQTRGKIHKSDPNCADLIRSKEVRIAYDPIRRVGGSDSGFENDIRPTHTHSIHTIADMLATAVSPLVPPPSSPQGSSKFNVLFSSSFFESSIRPQRIFKSRHQLVLSSSSLHLCLVASSSPVSASSPPRRRFISTRFSWRLGLESRRSSRRSSRLRFQSRRFSFFKERVLARRSSR